MPNPPKSQTQNLTNTPEDRALIEAVHPTGWHNPTPPPQGYTFVVIGGGPAGLVAAVGAAGLGARVALIENDLLGGDCLNVGCIPSKALLHQGQQARSQKAPNFTASLTHMRRIRSQLAVHDSAERMQKLGIDVYFGAGSFVDKRTIAVGNTKLRFRKALIATGSQPALPPIPGLAQAKPFTHKTIFNLTQPPKRLVILGGGAVGCELAQAFCDLGVAVDLIEAAPSLLPHQDPQAGAAIKQALKQRGVQVWTHTRALSIAPISSTSKDPNAHGHTVAETETEAEAEVEIQTETHPPQTLPKAPILAALGRTPNTQTLNLQAAGIHTLPSGHIKVTSRLATHNRRVFAAGDVCTPGGLTHTADAHARIVIQNALFAGRKDHTKLVIPQCTYTTPQVAHVGMPYQALTQAPHIQTFSIPLTELDAYAVRPQTQDAPQPFAKIYCTPKGQIVAATWVGENAAEHLAPITQAITHNLTLGQVARSIVPYPSNHEAWSRLANTWLKSRLTPKLAQALKYAMHILSH